MKERDRKIADSGWGIKPDDQPANAAEVAGRAESIYRYHPTEPDVIRRILLAQRRGFNTANRVRIEAGRTLIFDINKDAFVIEGLTFGDENLIELLKNLGAAFNPQELKELKPDENTAREFPLSRCGRGERSGRGENIIRGAALRCAALCRGVARVALGRRKGRFLLWTDPGKV